jgi:heme-degrading monooxygenase HmoA
MAHVRIAIFTFKSGTTHEVVSKAERELLPIFQEQPGFIAYTLAKRGDDTVLSYTVWESKRDAEAGNQASRAWVQENLSGILRSVEPYVGEVAFSYPPHTVHIPLD